MKKTPDFLINSPSNDEMSFDDLWQLILGSWRLMLCGLLVGLGVAGVYIAKTPKQYVASMVIKVGQVGVGIDAQSVESTEDAISRIRGGIFQKEVINALGWSGDQREILLGCAFQVKSPASNLLEIRSCGFSPDDAKHAVEASLAVLAKAHSAVAEKRREAMSQDFAKINANIVDADVYLHRIELLEDRISPNDVEGLVRVLLAVREGKSYLRDLQLKQLSMKKLVEPQYTTSTMAIEPVIVSSIPFYPNTRSVWFSAAIGGFLLGLLLILLRSIASMNKESRIAAD